MKVNPKFIKQVMSIVGMVAVVIAEVIANKKK